MSASLSLPKSKWFSPRRESSSTEITSASSFGGKPGVGALHGFDHTDPTHALAVEAAEDAKNRFHDFLPPSLMAQIYYEQHCVAPFTWEECRLGPLLGSGEFSNVYKIQSFRLANHQFHSVSEGESRPSAKETNQRIQMKKCEKYRQTKKARYALKHVKPDHLETREGRIKYVQAAGDLALEKEFLASLVHPHIIKLRGITHFGPTGFALIIDSLTETLDQRMRRWRNPRKTMRASIANLASSFSNTVKSEPKVKGDAGLDNRLDIAFQVSAAMKYLHSHSIIFRDLKPTNIGFDVRGDVKIFDFGLARFCGKEGNLGDTFKMSCAGTPRYMAPECLSGSAYNIKADVYSFAILLWEILAGKTPYAFVRREDQLVKYVVEDHGRPYIEQRWPALIKSTLERSFDVEMSKRPEMEHVYKNVREVLLSLRDGEIRELDDTWVSRRRSVESADGERAHD